MFYKYMYNKQISFTDTETVLYSLMLICISLQMYRFFLHRRNFSNVFLQPFILTLYISQINEIDNDKKKLSSTEFNVLYEMRFFCLI
jgi:hypothetical protein